METQLVRLDAPYNLICGRNMKLGLHIATLLVITKGRQDKPKEVLSYPVVEGGDKPGGEVWTDCELGGCEVICRQNDGINWIFVKAIMRHFYEQGEIHLERAIWSLNSFLMASNMHVDPFPADSEVELEFEENDNNICMVYSTPRSHLFFFSAFINVDDNEMNDKSLSRDADDAISHLVQMRDAYLMAFRYWGLYSIHFSTKDEKYREFVDRLNAPKKDGEQQ